MIWLIGAAAADLSTYKIPNKLCFWMATNGLMFRVYACGAGGFVTGAAGMAIPFGILFGFFAVGVIGAGDVKLLCAVGAFVGTDIWKVLLLTCAAAGITGVIRLAYMRAKKFPALRSAGKRMQQTTMHMSIPILCGYVMYATGGCFNGV